MNKIPKVTAHSKKKKGFPRNKICLHFFSEISRGVCISLTRNKPPRFNQNLSKKNARRNFLSKNLIKSRNIK